MSIKRISSYLFIILLLFPNNKCIFSVPDLTETSNKFNTYTIDFRGIDTPPSTYWSLVNFNLDLTDFKKTHSDVTGGGAYAGLQTLINGEKVAIISFWKINYKEDGEIKTLRFNRIYPPGEEMNFSGEGEGTTYRASYNWKTNVWYRFVLHTWEDDKTKNFFIGVWIQDLSTKEWTLFSYFNTNLNNSYIGGGNGALSLFQEIYRKLDFNYDRSFQFKNMYVFDKTNKKWESINTTYLYYNENPLLSKGVGFTQFYFYGFSAERFQGQNNNEENNNHFKASISQPRAPDFSKPTFKKFDVGLNGEKLMVDWEIDSTTCPCYQYSYSLEILQESGYNTIYSSKISSPEICTFTLYGHFKGTYRITVKATALSNEFVTKQIEKSF